MSIKRIVVILIIALVLLGLRGGTAMAYRAYRAPLGPARGSLAWDKTSVFNRLKELGLIP